MKGEKIPKFSLWELPLISKYRVLCFAGTADGTNLTRQFNINELENRSIVIKAIKLIPYAAGNFEDFFVSDGVVINTETLQDRMRLTRVIDSFTNSAEIDIRINGVSTGIFPTGTGSADPYPIDLSVDNVYYHYSEKVQDLDVRITAVAYDDLQTPGTDTVYELVLIECYIL